MKPLTLGAGHFVDSIAPVMNLSVNEMIYERNHILNCGYEIKASCDFTPYIHFRCVARATFDRNLIYSADACSLLIARVVYEGRCLLLLLRIRSTHLQILDWRCLLMQGYFCAV